MNARVLRAVLSITLGLAGMGLAAHAFGHLTRTPWVWWLAPLTVAVDGSLLFRAPVSASGALLWPSGAPIFADSETPIYFVSSIVAAGLAAWGAFTGNRLVIILGAVCAILGTVLEADETDVNGEAARIRQPQPATPLGKPSVRGRGGVADPSPGEVLALPFQMPLPHP